MNEPLLTIQIPYTEERQNDFWALCKTIDKQRADIRDIVELQWDGTGKEMTIGEKREKLHQRANGKFVWQIDSDDSISDGAIAKIIEAIKSNPEVSCITFRESCMMNGVYKRSNHSLMYSQWMDNSDGYDYVRSPFYKDAIRTDIAKSVPFPHIRYNEDEQWAIALYPHLKDEIHIDEELYFYIYNETNHEQRYGFDR